MLAAGEQRGTGVSSESKRKAKANYGINFVWSGP